MVEIKRERERESGGEANSEKCDAICYPRTTAGEIKEFYFRALFGPVFYGAALISAKVRSVKSSKAGEDQREVDLKVLPVFIKFLAFELLNLYTKGF